MAPTPEQITTLKNHGLDPARGQAHGRSLAYSWHGDTVILVNEHGSSSVYPRDMFQHAIKGLEK